MTAAYEGTAATQLARKMARDRNQKEFRALADVLAWLIVGAIFVAVVL